MNAVDPSSRNELVVALDLIAVARRDGCPLCGAKEPNCSHIVWAKAVSDRVKTEGE